MVKIIMNPSFDHLKNILQYPADAARLQAAFDARRLADVEKACRARPHFVPITHTLPAAVTSTPVVESSDALNHDVIIHGAITDGEDRNIRFYRDVESQSIVRYGDRSNQKLSLNAIAGHSVASAGLPGVFRYPEPFLLRQDTFLTLEMYQETNPGATETVATVFCGERVYTAGSDEGKLSGNFRESVLEHIRRRPAPETRYAMFSVAFAADGTADGETPKASEPQLILGFRTTFTDALVNLGFDSDNSFSKAKFPIWALCSEADNGRGLFQMLKSPLPVPANQQLLFSFKNTIDGSLMATNGNIEIISRTV